MLSIPHTLCMLAVLSTTASHSLAACRFVMFGVLVTFYVASAIFYDHKFRAGTGLPGKHIPWPSWAWCLGVASSLLWLLASFFMLGECTVFFLQLLQLSPCASCAVVDLTSSEGGFGAEENATLCQLCTNVLTYCLALLSAMLMAIALWANSAV